MTRRFFLKAFLKGGVLTLLGATLYPLLRYLKPPKGSEATVSEVIAAKAGELPANSAKIFRFGTRPAILINTPQGELRAFTAVCSHLNCTVNYDEKASVIDCACHNGKFDLNGQVLSGPPPKALEAYTVQQLGEDIIVSKNPA